MSPGARAFDSQANLTKQEFPQKKSLPTETKPTETKTPAISPDLAARFSRDKFVLAGAICSVLLLVITFFAMLPYLKSSPGMVLWQILSALHQTTSAEQQRSVRSAILPRETEMTSQSSTIPGKPNDLEKDRNTEQKTEGGIEPLAAENSTPGETVPPEAPVSQAVSEVPLSTEEPRNTRPAPSAEKSAKHWVVQVMATIYPDEAVVWMEKLNAKGYDAFVVEAEIAGKRWYRVRLGAFKTRGEAETLAALVRQKEGLRDAFVAGGATSATLALGRHYASPDR
jgi:cell division septation protein DedD